jgi:hypothetical protein
VDRTRYQSYKPWKIGIFPNGLSDMQQLRDSGDGLEIDLIFYSVNQVITVKFDSTEVYRVIDEGRRLKQLSHLPLPMGETIYMVENSDMVKELIDEAGIFEATKVVHYFIVADNDCIDVITRVNWEPQLQRRL